MGQQSLEQTIRVKVEALVKGLAEVKKLQGELQGVYKTSGKKLSFDTSQAASGANRITGIFRQLAGVSRDTVQAADAVGGSLGGLSRIFNGLFAAASGPVGILLALTGALVALAKGSIDAGSEIYDLSVQTGLSAETISALKLELEQTNKSIDDLTPGIAFFNAALADNVAKGDKASASYKRLGSDISNNETALRKAFQILNETTDAEERARIAKDFFSRSYTAALSVIEQTNGELDVAIAKHRALGDLIGTEEARAADALGDSLTQLWQQIKALGREIGAAALPALVSFLHFIVQNAPAIAAATAAYTLMRLATAALAVETLSLSAAVKALGIALSSAGGVGLLVGIAVALVNWAHSSKEVNIITGEAIKLTQSQVAIDEKRLAVLQQMSAATEAERARREALVAAMRAELQAHKELAAAQGAAVIQNFKQALEDELIAELNLQSAHKHQTSNLIEASKAYEEARAKRIQATQSLELYAAATGRSVESIKREIEADFQARLSKQTLADALLRVAGALDPVINKQLRLADATNSGTSAIEAQIEALRRQRRELELQASLRDETIRTNIAEIANQNLTPAQARAELERRRAPIRIPFVGNLPNPLDEAIRKNQRVAGLEKVLNAVVNPSGGGGGGGGRTKRQPGEPDDTFDSELSLHRTQLESEFNLIKDALEREKKILEENLKDRLDRVQDFYEGQERAIKEFFANQESIEQRANGAEIKRINDLMEVERKRHQHTLEQIDVENLKRKLTTDQANAKRIIEDNKHKEESVRLEEQLKLLQRERAEIAERNARAEKEKLRPFQDADIERFRAFQQEISSFLDEVNEANGRTSQNAIRAINERLQPLLEKIIQEEGEDSPLAQLLREFIDLVSDRARISELIGRADKFRNVFETRAAEVQAHTAQNVIAEEQARRRINELMQEYADKQLVILRQALAIAETNRDEDEIINLRRRIAEVEGLKQEYQSFNEELKNTAINAAATGLQNLFHDIVTGAKSAKEAMRDFLLSVLDALEQVIIKMLVFKAISFVLGLFGGGQSAGSSGGAGGFFSVFGDVGGYAEGGHIEGPGTATSDSILARLSKGEFVIPARAVNRYGLAFFERIRNLSLPHWPRFDVGGLVTAPTNGPDQLLAALSGGGGQMNQYNFQFNKPEDRGFRLPSRAAFRDAARTLRGAKL